jgi:hypothetical protein
MVVAKIRYEEGSYEGEVNEGKGKDDIHFLKCCDISKRQSLPHYVDRLRSQGSAKIWFM